VIFSNDSINLPVAYSVLLIDHIRVLIYAGCPLDLTGGIFVMASFPIPLSLASKLLVDLTTYWFVIPDMP